MSIVKFEIMQIMKYLDKKKVDVWCRYFYGQLFLNSHHDEI